jgi:cytochrome bd ubiquinol oxidase subunit II
MSSPLAYVVAGVLLLAVAAYSTAGGVDFGAGIWDLLAGHGDRGRKARQLIDHAMAPVWEVNNVWLVLSIVVCWTAFPPLFEAVFVNLYPLFALALIGLILRGAFFAFRHITDDPRQHRLADWVFGVSSVITPFFFASVLGAIASGRVGTSAPESVLQASFSPMSISFGLVSVAATALSGAVFLVGDARRQELPELVEYFRNRAVLAAGILIVVGTGALITVWLERPQLLGAMFTTSALVFVLAVMALTPLAAFFLWRRIYRWYRVLTVGAIGSLVIAWGFAQSPYLLPGRLTIEQAASPQSTLILVTVVAACVVLIICPSIALLVYLDQRSVLESPEG